MPALGLRRIRISADTSKFNAPVDLLTNQGVRFWRSSDLQFELGLFYGSDLITDISDLDSLTVSVKPTGESGGAPAPTVDPLMAKTITSFTGNMTPEQWAAKTHQHALITFTSTETNITAGKKWLVITAVLTGGEVVTILAGEIDCSEDGYNSAGTADVLTEAAWTKAEADARYPRRGITAPDWRSDITGLTGGTATDLDSIATVDLAAGYLIALLISGEPHWYVLTAGTTAEASPGIIRPDDYATTTNEKIWTQIL